MGAKSNEGRLSVENQSRKVLRSLSCVRKGIKPTVGVYREPVNLKHFDSGPDGCLFESRRLHALRVRRVRTHVARFRITSCSEQVTLQFPLCTPVGSQPRVTYPSNIVLLRHDPAEVDERDGRIPDLSGLPWHMNIPCKPSRRALKGVFRFSKPLYLRRTERILLCPSTNIFAKSATRVSQSP
jgi:hypothetical protein